MSESITLPRSGIVLTQDEHDYFTFDGGLLEMTICPSRIVSWSVHLRVPHAGATEFVGAERECIAWLDERVLALRSALLPPDAVERVAIAIRDSDIAGGTRIEQARAVLAALGVEHA